MPKLNDGLNANVKAKGKVESKTKSKATGTATGKRNGKSTLTDNSSETIPITESDNAIAAKAFFKTIRERKKEDGRRASVESEVGVVNPSPGPSRQKRPAEREGESKVIKDKDFGGDTGRMGGSKMKDEEEKERRRRLKGKEKAKEREKEKDRERVHSSPAPIASLEAYQASSPTYKSRLSDSLSRRLTIPSSRSNSKPTGLEAIKDTLRRPRPPTAPPGFSDDDDEPIYDSSNEEREKLRLAGVKFFEELKNRPIPISSPVYELDPYPYVFRCYRRNDETDDVGYQYSQVRKLRPWSNWSRDMRMN
jgi:hypothetical protein